MITTDLRWPGKPVGAKFLQEGPALTDVSVDLRASAATAWEVFADLHRSVFLPGFRAKHSYPLPGGVGTIHRLSGFDGRAKFNEYYSM